MIVTPVVVLKYRRDWNMRKIFWEFVMTWKAFLRGVSEIPILWGPIIIRRTAVGTPLAKADLKSVWEPVLQAVAKLSGAGIEHKELRHPQHHVIIMDRKNVSILDFERGKLTKKPRNVSRFAVWLLERGVYEDDVEKALKRLGNVPASDIAGAKIAVNRWKERKQPHG